MNADLIAFLNGLPPDVRDVVSALRTVVRRTIPQAEESIVWGGLSYHRPEVGGRVKGSVCLIVVKKGQVRLDFGGRWKLPRNRFSTNRIFNLQY